MIVIKTGNYRNCNLGTDDRRIAEWIRLTTKVRVYRNTTFRVPECFLFVYFASKSAKRPVKLPAILGFLPVQFSNIFVTNASRI